jgi:transcriptional accessory protein Tex/SPT6
MDEETKPQYVPKTMTELLNEELVECIEVFRRLLMEREITLAMGEPDTQTMKELSEEMSAMKKRQTAIQKLIEREEQKTTGTQFEDFVAFITIARHSL